MGEMPVTEKQWEDRKSDEERGSAQGAVTLWEAREQRGEECRFWN